MMNIKNSVLVLMMILASAAMFPQNADQNAFFDYHRKESGALSWNNFAWQDTRMLSLGGISLFASSAFSQAVNPAALPAEGHFQLGVNGSYFYHEAFQYWGLNEGVATIEYGRMSDTLWDLTSAFGLLKLSRFCFSAGWYLSNINAYPELLLMENYDYEQFFSYGGDFQGKEHTFFIAAGYQVCSALNIGVKLDYIQGNRDVNLDEIRHYLYWVNNNWVFKNLTITHAENNDYQILVPTLGIQYDISRAWVMALSVSVPLKGTVDREIQHRFVNDYDQIDINIQGKEQDPYHKPVTYRLATRYVWILQAGQGSRKRLSFGAEAQYTDWSGYKFIFFSEEIPRPFSSTLSLAVAIEYANINPGFSQYFRVGYRYDPQPVATPSTAINILTGGMGIAFWKLNLDLGFGYFFTSSLEYNQKHFITSGTISISL